MAIRFKYDTGSGMIASFAGGMQNAQRRNQKYAMDLSLLQQQHRNRLQQIGLAGGLRHGGRRAGGAVDDPLAPGDIAAIKAMGPGDRVPDPDNPDGPPLSKDDLIRREITKRAQRRRRGRLGRLGRADEVPMGDRREFIDADMIERRRDVQQEIDSEKRDFDLYTDKLDYATGVRREEERRKAEALPPVPTGASAADRTYLTQRQRAINELSDTERYSPDDPEARYMREQAKQEYYDRLEQMTTPDPLGELNADVGYRSIEGGFTRDKSLSVDGMEYRLSTGEPMPVDTSAQDATAAQQEQQQTRAAERNAAVRAVMDRRYKEALAERERLQGEVLAGTAPEGTVIPERPAGPHVFVKEAEEEISNTPGYGPSSSAAPSTAPSAGGTPAPGQPQAPQEEPATPEDEAVAKAQAAADQALQALESTKIAANKQREAREAPQAVETSAADRQAAAEAAADAAAPPAKMNEVREHVASLMFEVPKTKEEYEALPDGTPYYDTSDGETYIKGGPQATSGGMFAVEDNVDLGDGTSPEVTERTREITSARKEPQPATSQADRATFTKVLEDAGIGDYISEKDKGWLNTLAANDMAKVGALISLIRGVANMETPNVPSQRRGNQRKAKPREPVKYTGKQSQKATGPTPPTVTELAKRTASASQVAAANTAEALKDIASNLPKQAKVVVDRTVKAVVGTDEQGNLKWPQGSRPKPDESLDAWIARNKAEPYYKENLDIVRRMIKADLPLDVANELIKEADTAGPKAWAAIIAQLSRLEPDNQSPRSRADLTALKPRSVR